MAASNSLLSFLRKQESRKQNMKQYYVYILASKKNGTLYIGLTNNLLKRVYEHKNNFMGGFTKKYNVHSLVYYESYSDIYAAIAREKAMKKWKGQWKIELIENSNPQWDDLYRNIVEQVDCRLRGNDMKRQG
jgi:putative endonuclease